LQNKPEQFVRAPPARTKFREAVDKLVGDLVVDVNAEIAGPGEDFDYRGKLRDSVWVKDLAKIVVGDHVKLVVRGKIPSLRPIGRKLEFSSSTAETNPSFLNELKRVARTNTMLRSTPADPTTKTRTW
jgi:hypothetical protein